MIDGSTMISQERRRQVEEEGYTNEDDDRQSCGKLALAACCYAMPQSLYKVCTINGYHFVDPWPWDMMYDKRHRCEASDRGTRATPEQYTDSERIDLLVKAGALIASEIDRLNRRMEKDAKVDT